MELMIAADGIELSAAAHLPAELPAPVVVCSHGLLSAKESPKFVAIGEEMSKAGFCVLRFDFSGCGNSPPREATGLIQARKHDLEAAIDFALKQPWSNGRIGLLGSSLGGFLSLLTASENPKLIQAAVSWAAPFDISRIHKDTKHSQELQTAFPGGFGTGCPTSLTALSHAERVLLIHGQLDDVVSWKESVRIYKRLGEPKKFVLMRTADHRISDESWRKRAIRDSLDWFLVHLK